jgi:hypothetical protein
MVRRTASLTAALLASLLHGAVGRCDPSCPPRVVVDPGVPPRLAERLRAQLATLPRAEAHCGELLFRWDRSRLVIEVSLQDGRIARRTLRSLEDALPTALAVLATPPREDDAPAPPAAASSEPAPTPTPTVPTPIAPAEVPPAASVTAPTSAGSDLRLRVDGGLGGGWAHGRGIFAQHAEVALVWRRAIVAANAQWQSGDARDDGTSLRGQRYGLALRWRLPAGARWAFELGAVVAATSLRLVDDVQDTQTHRAVWSLGAGLDAGASLRLTRALHAFARAEALTTVVHFGDDPDGLYEGAPLSLTTTLGLRLEVSP